MAQVRVICIEKLRRIGFFRSTLDMLLEKIREYSRKYRDDAARRKTYPAFGNAHGYIVPSEWQVRKWRQQARKRRK